MNRRSFVFSLLTAAPTVAYAKLTNFKMGNQSNIQPKAFEKRTIIFGPHEYRFGSKAYNEAMSRMPENSLHIHAEELFRGHIRAIRRGEVEKWYDLMNSYDGLFIEDFHFIARGEATQDAIQYLLKKYSYGEKTVVVTCESEDAFFGNNCIRRDIRDFFA